MIGSTGLTTTDQRAGRLTCIAEGEHDFESSDAPFEACTRCGHVRRVEPVEPGPDEWQELFSPPFR